MRSHLSEAGFEESFEELIDTYPKAAKYMRVLYKDRERWAAAFSMLTFSVASFTTSRVEGMPEHVPDVLGFVVSWADHG